MKTIKLYLFAFVTIIFVSNFKAQIKSEQWCFTDQHAEEMKIENPDLIQEEQNFRLQVRAYIDNHPQYNANPETSPYIIPVVFHCITDNGVGYVSKANIEDQILTLNEDFQRMNADASNTRSIFSPYAMSMNIEFRLAHIDPNGNCTEGIVRLDSPLSTNADNSVKSLSYWDSHKYFNIWTVNSIDNSGFGIGTIAGYAQFPWSGINSSYGVVIGGFYIKRGDRVLTHEIGHCFGLLHTFQSGCGNNCSNSGDQICDTPPSSASTQGCSSTQNTCSNDASGPDPFGANVVDQIENYMSYDACQNMFSLEQKSAMESTLNSTSTTNGLNQLNTTANRIATGVADPYNPTDCAPIADFNYDKKYICEGDSVTFTDFSYNGTPTIWSWTFVNGTPAVSALPSPTIIYNTPGFFDVSYQPSSSGGSAVPITKNSIITVSSLTADYVGPLVDGFESNPQFINDWIVVNHAGNGETWVQNINAATTGTGSVRIRNILNSGIDKHDLISPSFDISTITSKRLKFKQAFAKRASGNNDVLKVSWSIDCGETWVIKLALTVSALSTAPNLSSEFVPNSTQWVDRVIDLTPIGFSTNVRFKFEFVEGGGNDIYIDDINIGDFTIGIDDLSNTASFSVYPNPTKSSAQISFNLIKEVKNLSIKVRNAVGQEVTNVINNQSFAAGKYTLKIDEQRKLSSGIYFIEFNADDNVKVQKLIVQ